MNNRSSKRYQLKVGVEASKVVAQCHADNKIQIQNKRMATCMLYVRTFEDHVPKYANAFPANSLFDYCVETSQSSSLITI